MDATSTSSACLRETYIDTDISSRFKISGFDLISYSVRNGSTLGQGAVHPDSLVAPPDSTASWKNISLYGVRIFQFRRTNKMDSVMKRLMGQCPPPNFRARTSPGHRLHAKHGRALQGGPKKTGPLCSAEILLRSARVIISNDARQFCY